MPCNYAKFEINTSCNILRSLFIYFFMSVQNTDVIPAPLLYFSSILYINKGIIAPYLIFGSLCITGEYDGFQKLCGDMKKK